MRLGIRRKLIGTLMLVGLFPLALSLVVILGGGAVIRLDEIRKSYFAAADGSAEHISLSLHEEIEKLVLVCRAPRVIDYVRAHNRAAAKVAPTLPLPVPKATAEDIALDRQWPSLKDSDEPLAALRANEVGGRLRLLSQIDGHERRTFITNAAGETIAADGKTDDYFQADEAWWQTTFDEGRGRVYISSITKRAAMPEELGMTPATAVAGNSDVIEIAIPIFDTIEGKPVVVGILKDKLAINWLLRSLFNTASEKATPALKQLVDLDDHKTVFNTGAPDAGEAAENFYFTHPSQQTANPLSLLFSGLILAATPVDTMPAVPDTAMPPGVLVRAQVPHWVVVVSNPSAVAMTPVYRLALTVALIGVALILVLFVLGVAISNREIIMPILRLREATAAVGRGELNVRLLSTGNDKKDPTFRQDELGGLAQDFDQMTRQLQKNVNQLARSNEAKRRFMELAGHELRTPVTYLIGVCQLAQRQLQQIAAAATDGVAEDAATTALAAKNAAAVTSALGKIAAKTGRLSRIIDNLLKLVNNDQFTTRMNKQSTDMRALILQVTADQRPFVTERKQQLIIDVPPNLPSLEADRDKLEDALTNLLSNAIRFSPDGSAVRISAHEIVGDMLEILVEDSGPGIPQQDLANLFEPFYTGSDILHHHSGTIEYGSKGIGLGLAIVRRFVELHGGVVRAHALSKDNQITGTQFQILLPLTKPPEPADGTTPTNI